MPTKRETGFLEQEWQPKGGIFVAKSAEYSPLSHLWIVPVTLPHERESSALRVVSWEGHIHTCYDGGDNKLQIIIAPCRCFI